MANFLIISPTPFAPANAGNRARIFNIINMLRDHGHGVSFVHVERELGDRTAMAGMLAENFYRIPYTVDNRRPSLAHRLLRRVGRKLRIDWAYQISADAWYPDSIDGFVHDLLKTKQFDVVMVEYVFFSKLLDTVSDEYIKVIDTHDVFANRHRKYLSMGLKPAWFSCSPAEEAKGLNRADIVCAIQSSESEYFKRKINSDVVTLGHAPIPTDLPQSYEGEPFIAYLGSNNPINQASIEWFLREVWPVVRVSSSVKLIIGGSVGLQLATPDGVEVMGEIEDLESFYAKAHVVINPAQFGTGLKIKSVETLAYGRPLVTTAVGIEGLHSTNPPWLEANSSRAFAAAIVQLLEDEDFHRSQSIASLEFVREYSRQAFAEFQEVLSHKLSTQGTRIKSFANVR